MTDQTLTAAQLEALEQQLLARRAHLQEQMVQNKANLEPAQYTAGSASQDDNARLSNLTREVDTRLTSFDLDELDRIDRALDRVADGSYGLCDDCGQPIPFMRLRAEPMTQHCVPCKSRREQRQAQHR